MCVVFVPLERYCALSFTQREDLSGNTFAACSSWGCCNTKTVQNVATTFCTGTKYRRDILAGSKCRSDNLYRPKYRDDNLSWPKCHCDILSRPKYRDDNLPRSNYRCDILRHFATYFVPVQNVVATFCTVLVLQQPQEPNQLVLD